MADHIERIKEIKAEIKALRKELSIAEKKARFNGRVPLTTVSDKRLMEVVEVYKSSDSDPIFFVCEHFGDTQLPGWKLASWRCSKYFNLAESTIKIYIREAERRGLVAASEVQHEAYVEARRG